MTVSVYQIPFEAKSNIHPESPFMYKTGSTKFFDLDKHINLYEKVADLDCETLNEAFEIGNIGPEYKYTRFKDMHSVSVGDILQLETGEAYVVAPYGFDELEVDLDS